MIDHGPEATKYLKAFIGDHYVYSDKPVFRALWENYNSCQFVEDEGTVLDRHHVLCAHTTTQAKYCFTKTKRVAQHDAPLRGVDHLARRRRSGKYRKTSTACTVIDSKLCGDPALCAWFLLVCGASIQQPRVRKKILEKRELFPSIGYSNLCGNIARSLSMVGKLRRYTVSTSRSIYRREKDLSRQRDCQTLPGT